MKEGRKNGGREGPSFFFKFIDNSIILPQLWQRIGAETHEPARERGCHGNWLHGLGGDTDTSRMRTSLLAVMQGDAAAAQRCAANAFVLLGTSVITCRTPQGATCWQRGVSAQHRQGVGGSVKELQVSGAEK